MDLLSWHHHLIAEFQVTGGDLDQIIAAEKTYFHGDQLYLAIAGIHLSDIPALNYRRHLFQERQVRSVTSNTRSDAREFLAFAGRHRLAVTSPEYPLDRAANALEDLSAGRVAGAAVLVV